MTFGGQPNDQMSPVGGSAGSDAPIDVAAVPHRRSQLRPTRLWTAVFAILAVALPTIVVMSSDGWIRRGALLLLLVLPVWWVSRTRDNWTRIMVVVLVAVIGASSAAMAWQYAHERFGGLVHTPMAGSTDQKDFTLMAWTWMTHSSLGVAGGSPAKEVVDAYENGTAVGPADRYSAWVGAQQMSELPQTYSYRAPAYPLLLGSIWKVTGYQPDHAALLNIGLLVAAVIVLTVGIIRFIGLPGGVLAGLTLSASQEPIRWAAQGLSESLSVLLVAVCVVATLGVLRSSSSWWWLPLGLALGFLGLTKQMFIVTGLLYLVVVALVVLFLGTQSRARVMGAAAGAGLVAVTIVLPWLSYNVSHTGTVELATGTAGWHDMPASYSLAYLGGEDRHSIRERHFDAWEARTGEVLADDVSRAKVGRYMWESQYAKGDYLTRLPELMTYKAARSLAVGPTDWLIRAAAILGLLVVFRFGVRRDWATAACLLALPLCLLLFVSLTVEAGSRLMVTSAVSLAAILGLALQLYLDREREPDVAQSKRLLSPNRG